MRFAVNLLAREVFSIELDRPGPAAAPDETAGDDGKSVGGGSGHNFGFAAPAARAIDYPESRWDATQYGEG